MALPSTGKKATATPSNPGSALTDFTFIVDLSDLPQAWWDDVNTTDGTRGRAAKNDETTELPVDWIDFDDTAQTGLARIKYTGTKSASVSEPVIIYPPNTRNTAYSASDTYGQYNAYPSDLLAYLPLSSDFNDRTSNGNNATAVGSPTAGDATGQLGQATNFDGAQYLQLPSGLKNVSDGAAFVTAKSDIMASPQGYAYSERTSGVNDRLYLRVDSDTNDYAVGFADAAIAITSDNNVEGDGNYHNFTMSYNSTTAEGYLDGSSLGSYAGALAAGTATINIGSALDDTSFCFIGDLQHYLKYNTAKSTDFVSYEYSQTSDNSAFWGTWTVSDVSGGTTYNVTCADSLSLSDLTTATAIISGALSDGVNLTDTTTLARILNLSTSDGLALADLSGTALALNLSASEIITFSDAITAITNINATLSDIAKFIDSVAASSFAPINVSCSDGLLLADAAQGSLSLDLTAIDGLELTDASGSTITFNVQCPDGIELSDFASAALIILGSCVDGLALTDLAQETSFLPQGMVRIVGTGKAYKVIFDIVKRPKITGGN